MPAMKRSLGRERVIWGVVDSVGSEVGSKWFVPLLERTTPPEKYTLAERD